jgi:hypothetical protein
MSNLNIVIDRELLAGINYAAMLAGLTQQDWVAMTLRKAIDPAPPKPEKPKAAPSPAAKLAPCNVCEGPCVQWGPAQRHCTKCSRNFQLEAN